MSSYLEKYHLQKVEPVKRRGKNTAPDFYKLKEKVQKGNVVKIPIKPHPPIHRNYFQREEPRSPPRNPKTEQLIKINNQFTGYHFRRADEKHKRKQEQLSGERPTHRSHQSLTFKSLKETSTGDKILATIQDFFRKLVKSKQGCNCGEPCPHGVKFFQWADIPLEIVKDHYFKVLRAIEQVLDSAENEESKCSIENELSQKTIKSPGISVQIRKNAIQIRKDLDRTQSESPTFQNIEFKQMMGNILMVYGFEDAKVGYIQGMNMILSGIAYHVKDEIRTYAVFRKLIFTIRSTYINGFKECYSHIDKIKSYLNTHVHDLYEMFQELTVDLNVVCLPWVLSLLTCIVPLDHLHLIYLGFFESGWSFFYRVSLAILIYHKQSMLTLYDAGEILSLLSATNEKKGSYDWEDIIEYSKSIVL